MRRDRKAINQMNVVPYIDVMLVLLVIFMVTAPLITGQVELPSVGSKLAAPGAAARGDAAQRPEPVAARHDVDDLAGPAVAATS